MEKIYFDDTTFLWKTKLNKLVKVEDDRDPIVIDGEAFDLDKELGIDKDE